MNVWPFGKKTENHADWLSLMFDRDRAEISEQMELMADRALAMTHDALDALFSHDRDRAEAVAARDSEVDRMELEIEDLCLSSLALRQPVRENLRFVFSALKTLTDLERVGDQGVNIAHRAKKIATLPMEGLEERLTTMLDLANAMVHDAVQALLDDDAALARQVVSRDDEVDNLNRRIYHDLLNYLRTHHDDDGLIEQINGLIIVARNIERVGDHGANIAERAYYTVTGERLALEPQQHHD